MTAIAVPGDIKAIIVPILNFQASICADHKYLYKFAYRKAHGFIFMTAQYTRPEEDHQLIIAVKQGDQRSLGLIYNKYAPALMGIISRIACNKEVAEEILRTTFLKIWDRIGTYDTSKGSLFSWLINTARTEARKVSVAAKNPKDPDHVYDLSLGESLQQTAFDLVYYRGLKCDEVAAALNIPVETVRAMIREAFQNLKTMNEV